MRKKEEANDYRYFPCPDLLPIIITDQDIAAVRKEMPELATDKNIRYVNEFGLSKYDASFLTNSRQVAEYFEQLVSTTKDAKLSANWVMGELSKALNRHDITIESCPVTAEDLAALLSKILDNTISGKIAKEVFEAMWQGEGSPEQIIEDKGLKQITDTGAIGSLVDEVIANNPTQVAAYKGGQQKMFGFFVGQIMKASKGKANPAQINEVLKAKLK